MLLKEKIDVFINKYYTGKLSVLLTGNAVKRVNENNDDFETDIELLILGSERSKIETIHCYNLRFDILYINKNKIGKEIARAFFGNSKLIHSLRSNYIIRDDFNEANRIIEISNKLFDMVSGYNHTSYKEVSRDISNIQKELNTLKESDLLINYYQKLSVFNSFFNFLIKIKSTLKINTNIRGEVLKSHKSTFSSLLSNTQDQHPILDINLLEDYLDTYCIHYFDKERRKTVGVLLDKQVLQVLSSGMITSFYFGYNDLMENSQVVFVNIDDVDYLKQKVETIDTVEYLNFTPGITMSTQVVFTEFLKNISRISITLNADQRKLLMQKIFNYYSKKISILDFEKIIKKILLLNILEIKITNKSNIDILELEVILNRLNSKININTFYETNDTVDQLFGDVIGQLISLDEKILERTSEEEQIDIFILLSFRILKSLRLEITDLIEKV